MLCANMPSPARVQIYPLPANSELYEEIFVKACNAGNEAEVQHLLHAAPNLTNYEHYHHLLNDCLFHLFGITSHCSLFQSVLSLESW